MITGVEHLLVKERLRELELFNPEKRRLKGLGQLNSINTYLMEGNRGAGARLLVVATDRARCNGHELKDMKFHLNTRIYLAQVAQRSFGISICEDVKNPTGHGHRQPALADSVLAARLT